MRGNMYVKYDMPLFVHQCYVTKLQIRLRIEQVKKKNNRTYVAMSVWQAK